jgi:hypothetical protein
MILKLISGKILIRVMFVPELKSNTYIQYEFEEGTAHLHPVLYFGNQIFKGDRIFIDIKDEVKAGDVVVKVELLDHQNKIIHIYESKVAYNIYQVLGQKPIRPDIEDYLYKLEEEIRVLKETLINETNRLNQVIKDLEEKGEIV